MPVGSMQFIHLESEDHKVVVQVLARIIRVSDIDDLVRGKSVGLAVEFMPATLIGRQNVARLVRHVVELGLSEDNIGYEIGGALLGPPSQTQSVERPLEHSERSSLQPLDIRKIVLETEWRANVGDAMEVYVRRPHAIPGQSYPTAALAGQVTNVNEIADAYRVEVRVTGLAANLPDAPVATLADLISEGEQDFELPTKDHLSGLLSRVQLPTLLSLLEMEQMTGVLRIHRNESKEGEAIALFIRNGRLLDANSSLRATLSLRQLLGQLMNWEEGFFQFDMEEMAEDERHGSSLTELILDLAADADAAGRS